MNITEKFFIEVLRAFATGTEPKLNTVSVDTEELFCLAKRHSLIGVVAYMANRYKLFAEEEIEQLLAKEYDRTVMQMINREATAVRLCKQLTQLQIPHILFKGMTVSEVYPVAELRTYGDVDIIVRQEDVAKIREYMKSAGYDHSIADGGVVNVYKKNREHYEMHTALNVSNIKDSEYFSAIWDNTAERSGETLMFNHNFHLSYLICHLEKHVYGSGAGARMYLDIALYIEKHRDEVDLDFVRDTLENCGLKKFFDTVLYVCYKWFDLSIPAWVAPMEDGLYAQMCEFILSGGVFGMQSEESVMSDSLRRQVSAGKKGAKFRLIISRVFPPFYELCRLYPRYEGKPLLAPVAWFNHIWQVVSNRKLSRVKEIASADMNSAEKKKLFLENIGSKR